MIKNHPKIKFPAETKPQLIVVIDTEEEFDWDAKPDKDANAVTAMEKIHLVQDIFNQYNIQPCYVIDYPIASQATGYDPLLQFHKNNQCEIGAHLHPWVNPPFGEELSRKNMYPHNLDYQLQLLKLKVLKEKIKEIFNFSPHIYKAGRSGFGNTSYKLMEELGFNIDLSICPRYNYTPDGGPDFRAFSTDPFWFGSQNQLLEIPLSGSFVGIAGNLSSPIYKFSDHFDFLKAKSMLSHLSIVDRLVLSPEGFTSKEHIKLTHSLYNKGVRTFTWNFHNTTLLPGMNSYTQSKQDIVDFLDKFYRFFDFFFDKMGGQATTPSQLKQKIQNK